LAGLIAGFFGFMVNVVVQWLFTRSINFLTALGTGLGLLVVFALISRRYVVQES
jgi:hypothetical protein